MNQHAHLSEEQFSVLLLEQGDDAMRVHLADCAECSAELERVRESLASFNAMGMEWAERRSATLGPVQAPARNGRRMPLVWATATAVAVGAIFAGVHYAPQAGTKVEVAAVAPAASITPAVVVPAARSVEPVRVAVKVATTAAAGRPAVDSRIEADNRLLAAIDHELNSGEPLLVPVSELRTDGGKAQRRLND